MKHAIRPAGEGLALLVLCIGSGACASTAVGPPAWFDPDLAGPIQPYSGPAEIPETLAEMVRVRAQSPPATVDDALGTWQITSGRRRSFVSVQLPGNTVQAPDGGTAVVVGLSRDLPGDSGIPGSFREGVLHFTHQDRGFTWGTRTYDVAYESFLMPMPNGTLLGLELFHHPYMAADTMPEAWAAGTDVRWVSATRFEDPMPAFDRLGLQDPLVGTWTGQGSSGTRRTTFWGVEVSLLRGTYTLEGTPATFDGERLTCTKYSSGWAERYDLVLTSPGVLEGTVTSYFAKNGHTSAVRARLTRDGAR